MKMVVTMSIILSFFLYRFDKEVPSTDDKGVCIPDIKQVFLRGSDVTYENPICSL